jgi:tetratricopeptide (TPR) repeat protein
MPKKTERRNITTLCLSVCSLAFAALALLFADGSAPAYAASSTAKVTITVLDETGNPVASVPVTLTCTDEHWKPRSGDAPQHNKTSGKGVAAFGFVRVDNYQVTVDVPGKQLLMAGVKFRDNNKRRILLPEGPIEDKEGPLEPNNPQMLVAIPQQASFVEIKLGVGPKPAPQAASSEASGAVDIKDRELKAKLREAVNSIQAGSYADGLAEVDKVLEKRDDIKPNDLPSVLYMRGFCLYQLKRESEAEPPLKESVALDPKFDSGWDLLARLYIRQKNFAGTADAFGKELTLVAEPERRAPLLYQQALALRELQRDAEALPLLEQANKTIPADTDIVIQLADLYSAAGRNAEAEQLITSANVPPEQASVLQYNIAAAAVKRKQWDDAEAHFRKALELNPGLGEARYHLANVLINANKRADAVKELEAFIAADPNAPLAPDAKVLLDAIKRDLASKPAPAAPKKK